MHENFIMRILKFVFSDEVILMTILKNSNFNCFLMQSCFEEETDQYFFRAYHLKATPYFYIPRKTGASTPMHHARSSTPKCIGRNGRESIFSFALILLFVTRVLLKNIII